MAPTAVLRGTYTYCWSKQGLADESSTADLVQDLYLRELKNYKPTPLKASDASGHVQTFSPPKPPPSPEEIEIASDLKAYEAQTVEVEGQREAGQEDVDELSKFFEDFGDEEEAHH